jgi:hypothetical protein
MLTTVTINRSNKLLDPCWRVCFRGMSARYPCLQHKDLLEEYSLYCTTIDMVIIKLLNLNLLVSETASGNCLDFQS